MKQNRCLFYCMFFVLMLANLVYAQDSTQINVYTTLDTNSIKPLNDSLKSENLKFNVWGTVGVCVIGGMGELNLRHNKNIYSFQYIDNRGGWGDDSDFLGASTKSTPDSKEYGLLYGRILTGDARNFYSSISAGISRMYFSSTYHTDIVYGYPVKFKMMYRSKYFGIGTDVIVNFNNCNNYFTIMYHISLGKLK